MRRKSGAIIMELYVSELSKSSEMKIPFIDSRAAHTELRLEIEAAVLALLRSGCGR